MGSALNGFAGICCLTKLMPSEEAKAARSSVSALSAPLASTAMIR